MLLHYDVCFFAQGVYFLHRAYLKSKIDTAVTLVFYLEYFCEVAITKLLDHFKVFELKRVLVGFNQICNFFGSKLWLSLR